MTRTVVTASPDASLNDIAVLLENNTIKRVTIVESGELVASSTGAILIQALTRAPARLALTNDPPECTGVVHHRSTTNPMVHKRFCDLHYRGTRLHANGESHNIARLHRSFPYVSILAFK
jgi:hypothetical protein